MFICLIRLLHLQAMFNYKMDLRCYFTCLHVLELLLFIAAIITYDIYLNYMPILFRINIFNIIKLSIVACIVLVRFDTKCEDAIELCTTDTSVGVANLGGE
jgi:hypothetical protein